MTRELMIFELSNDYAFVILMVIGALAVLAYVYRDRIAVRKKEKGE